LNIFEIFLTLNIQLVASFGSINWILMWPLATSYILGVSETLRWHSIDYNGWGILSVIAPIISQLVFFICCHINLAWRLKVVCEAMVHGIKTTLDVHHDWVVFQMNVAKAFNTILHKGRFFGALNNKRPIVLAFPFCSSLICHLTSFVLQSSFPK
jgi:hypothetical protein